jgi:hypothetical protein
MCTEVVEIVVTEVLGLVTGEVGLDKVVTESEGLRGKKRREKGTEEGRPSVKILFFVLSREGRRRQRAHFKSVDWLAGKRPLRAWKDL